MTPNHASNSLSRIFKKGSTTYFYSSIFFHQELKRDVTTLYAFVRVADDFVDATPQQKKQFYAWKKKWETAFSTKKKSGDRVIDAFLMLVQKYSLSKKWVDAFLQAMEADLYKKKYTTLAETKKYMYGSAEVVGLMMCSLMGVDSAFWPQAQLLGRAMQYTNFIRDIAEDYQMGRQYIPQKYVAQVGLKSLTPQHSAENQAAFKKLMQKEVSRAVRWYELSKTGISALPFRARCAVSTATELYIWALRSIAAEPSVVWRTKVKPSKLRVLYTATIVLVKNLMGKS